MVKHKCSKKRSREQQNLWRAHSPFSVEEHLLSFLFYTWFHLTLLRLPRPHISPLLRLILAASNFNFTWKWTPLQIQNFNYVLVNFESFYIFKIISISTGPFQTPVSPRRPPPPGGHIDTTPLKSVLHMP